MVLPLGLAGCGLKAATDNSTSSSGPLFGAIGSESSYCTTVSSPSPATTITSTAQFNARVVSRTLGLIAPTTKPIRYAEVQILQGSSVIQCGETSVTGTISVDMPRVAGTYTLKVNSRAYNSYYKASVLNNPTSMTPYSISVSFTISAADVSGGLTTKAVSLPVADYQGTLEGGGFNILDQIYVANDYIRNNTTCPNMGSVCTSFTVAPKAQIFWTPGLSPGAYYSSPTSAISFFIPDNNSSLGMATGIYIMGGINGSVCVDTDHFDNSIIIHEYGHFLEKNYAKSDSPGGSHNGNGVIDPRLAWSEGWANFLQGVARSDNHYVDTHGNSNCSDGTGVSIDLNLETITSGQDAVNGSTYLGEGIFREVSVSRALWDMVEAPGAGSPSDGFGADLGFGSIWKAFSDASVGFAATSIHFRNIGHFNEVLRALVNTNAPARLTDFDSVVSNERQRSDRLEYANPMTVRAIGSCSNTTIIGVNGVNNLAKTNDFLSYYYDGTAAHSSLRLRYTATPSGTPTDLDLYVWKDGYSFSTSSTMAGSSARNYPEVGGNGEETVSLSGQAAGYYLIQVATDPDHVNANASYIIETNSGSEGICP
jgi:hypothetical protein